MALYSESKITNTNKLQTENVFTLVFQPGFTYLQ